VLHLVGLEAVTTDEKRLGRVTGLLRAGGNELLVIEGENGRELLVPFVDEICQAVDLDARRITINPPEGLLDL
jgi:16S rRNA processing protein RimM